MRVSPLWSVVVLVGLAPACAAVWGFEDATLATDAGRTEAGPGTSSGGASSGGVDLDASSAIDADTPVPEGCTRRMADPSAIFVDSYAAATSGPCTAEEPCQNIQAALTQVTNARTTIYVGRGTYAGFRIPAEALGLGLRVEGRWNHSTGAWLPDCETNLDLTIQGDQERTVEVIAPDAVDGGAEADAAGETSSDAGPTYDLTLAYLYVQSRPAGEAGTSTFALFARSTRVAVVGSTIVADRAANGFSPLGRPPLAAGNDGCTSSQAGAGGAGADGTPLALGRFTRDGFVVPTAPASPPENGKQGVCAGCLQSARGGTKGQNGGGGGASVAAYLWDATLDLSESAALVSVGGGAGGNGGQGGEGSTYNCSLGGGSSIGGVGGTGSPGAGGHGACIVHGGTSASSPLTAGACKPPEVRALGGAGGTGTKADDGEAATVFVVTEESD